MTVFQEMVVESILLPNQMILVSFFSEDNILFDEIKICCIFEFQSNEKKNDWAFRFFWTPGIVQGIVMMGFSPTGVLAVA